MGRITIRKEKNSFTKGGFLYVVSENGERRLTKGTKAEATQAANRFRKRN